MIYEQKCVRLILGRLSISNIPEPQLMDILITPAAHGYPSTGDATGNTALTVTAKASSGQDEAHASITPGNLLLILKVCQKILP